MSVLTGKTIFVTGANGFLGKHVCKKLQGHGANIVRNAMDLTNSEGITLPDDMDLVIHLAADVRGIGPNRAQPYRFLHNNTLMTLNLLNAIYATPNIPIVAAGSVCAYPEDAPLPFNETDFWNGKVEKNNYGYGLSKRFLGGALECAAMEFGLRCVHLISANLYGPGDSGFQDEGGHVIPSLIKRFYRAKWKLEPSVEIWGSGKPTRDFLYVDDAARAYTRAAEYLLEGGENLECNIGSSNEVSIADIAKMIAYEVGYDGKLIYDTSKPDGQMRRRINTNKADVILEWCNTTSLSVGINRTVRWYAEEMAK